MKKMLLTSAGFLNPKIADKFLELVNKPVAEIKVLFIPTASRTAEELNYVEESRQELLELGILKKNIIEFNLDRKLAEIELNNFNVVYVCGGNTFYLMQKLKASGFDKILKNLIDVGIVYVGVSAGSVIVGPDIGVAVPYDENDIGLTDICGLNVTQTIPSPHYTDADKEIVADLQTKLNYAVLPLTDRQALLVIDDKSEIIE